MRNHHPKGSRRAGTPLGKGIQNLGGQDPGADLEFGVGSGKIQLAFGITDPTVPQTKADPNANGIQTMKCHKLSRQELRIQVFSRGRQGGSRAVRPASAPAMPPFPGTAPAVADLLPSHEAMAGSDGRSRAQGLLEFLGFLGVGSAFLAAAILL